MTHTLRHELAIRIYMGLLILGVNTVYIAFCFVRTLAMVGKGLTDNTITQQAQSIMSTLKRRSDTVYTLRNDMVLEIITETPQVT